MKNTILWSLFFIICMGVGFLHGVLPQGLSRSYLSHPAKIQVLTTDEILFPAELRSQIEDELNVKFSVVVTRDWDMIIANLVASPSVDLVFLPSFWAQNFSRQNLLTNLAEDSERLKKKVASDFAGHPGQDFNFFPFYWMKTTIQGPDEESFEAFLNNKKQNILFLLADEDLLYHHFQQWKAQGLLDLVSQKKILTLQLDQLLQDDERLGASEKPLRHEVQDKEITLNNLGALLIWGAVIPQNSNHKAIALKTLEALSSSEKQSRVLLKTPFNSTLGALVGNEIPLQRRAEFIRNLQLKNTLILDKKDKDAKLKLRNEFNLIL